LAPRETVWEIWLCPWFAWTCYILGAASWFIKQDKQ
jgi:hypothetical protein